MNRDWESVFSAWSQGPGKTEQERVENTERQIKQAIQASDKLKKPEYQSVCTRLLQE